MALVRIFKKETTLTQSGRAHTDVWVAEFAVELLKLSDGSMQWKNTTNTNRQLTLYFDTQEKAENWAKDNDYDYRVLKKHDRKIKPKAYADNFAHNRVETWTH